MGSIYDRYDYADIRIMIFSKKGGGICGTKATFYQGEIHHFGNRHSSAYYGSFCVSTNYQLHKNSPHTCAEKTGGASFDGSRNQRSE